MGEREGVRNAGRGACTRDGQWRARGNVSGDKGGRKCAHTQQNQADGTKQEVDTSRGNMVQLPA